MIELTVPESANDQRADRYLHKRFDVPKSAIQKWFRNKKVKRDKKTLRASDRVSTDDVLSLYAQAPFRDGAAVVDKKHTVPLHIVSENENLMILYKPQGQLSHAAHGKEYGKNVVDAMIAHLIASGEYIPRNNPTFTPALVNRLDRNTAGLLIGAKNYKALKALNAAMRAREIRKFYLALTASRLPGGVYEDRLEKDEEKLRVHTTKEGKYVRLDILDSEPRGRYFLHTIELHTGRTHQIRAQLAAAGAPIVGDPKYGDPAVNRTARNLGLRHQFLVAHALTFLSDDPLLSSLQGKTIRADGVPAFEQFMMKVRQTE